MKFNHFGNNQQHGHGKCNNATSPVWEEVLANALQDGAGSKGKHDDDVVEWASADCRKPISYTPKPAAETQAL